MVKRQRTLYIVIFMVFCVAVPGVFWIPMSAPTGMHYCHPTVKKHRLRNVGGLDERK